MSRKRENVTVEGLSEVREGRHGVIGDWIVGVEKKADMVWLVTG